MQHHPERRLWRWYRSLYLVTQLILAIVILFLSCTCFFLIGPPFIRGFNRGLNQPVVITPDTTPAPQWIITSTFSGSGSGTTDTFTVAGDWELNWTCSPASGPYNVVIDVDQPRQSTPVFPSAVYTTCSPDVYSGSVEEHQPGTFTLAVKSSGPWTVQIEQLI